MSEGDGAHVVEYSSTLSYTHRHICTQTHTHTHTFLQSQTLIHSIIQAHTHTHTHIHTHTHTPSLYRMSPHAALCFNYFWLSPTCMPAYHCKQPQSHKQSTLFTESIEEHTVPFSFTL